MSFGRSLYNGWTSVMSHWIALSDPQRAFAYTRQREVLLSYKAASKKGPNRAWRGDNRSADEVLLRDWKDVTARARELVQSSSHIAGALEKICSNVIYTGIVPQAQLKKSNGVFDKVRNDAVESRFSKWARSKKVRWFEKVKLVLRHLWQDGEILVHWFIDPTMLEEGLVPLRVELLEADHFDASVHGQLRNGNYARRGIEFDATGDPVAYHLFTEHPGNCGAMLLAETRRIPADNIIHIFEPKRASQTRGISWLYAVIMRMRDLDEYEESERIAARLTSAFAFFLETPFPEFDPRSLGGALPGFEGEVGSTPTMDANGVKVPDFVQPGRIQTIPMGSKINASGFQRPGDQHVPFLENGIRGASTAMQMSFQSFANDDTKTSWASGRPAIQQERRGYRLQQEILNDKLNDPVWEIFIRALYLSGLEPGIGPVVPVSWQAPGWQWVDPYKDAQSAEKKLSLNVITRRQICSEMGVSFEETLEQLAREEEMMREKGLLKEAPNAQ